MSPNDGTPKARGASPARLVNASLGVARGVTVLLVVAAQRLPALPFGLEIDGERLVTRPSGAEVTEIRATGPEAAPFHLEPVDLIEEPDVAGSWAELESFYGRQGEIWKRLQGSTVDVRVGGAWRSVPIVRRSLTQLPLAFYTLLVASLVTWMVGFVTYAFSDRGPAARMYAISAVAFCVAVWPAALYAARPLAMDPDQFRLLSTADHVGALLFAAGVISMLAVYPVRLMRSTSWLWALAVFAGVAGHYQWGDMAISGFYTANAAQFVLFLGFSFWQWRSARRNPVQRAAFGWILLSTFVGVIFFFTLITLPVLLGSPPVITQTTGLVSMVVMYVGISLGVLRFRLFELDRWWFRTWSWILSGMAVVGVDLVLTHLFDVKQNVALVAAVVVVGWVYFPIRQRMFERLGRARKRTADYDAKELIAAATVQDLRASFRDALQSSFDPLEILETKEAVGAPRLTSDGAWLEVPSPTRDGAFRCHFRENGARLYAREDVERANHLLTLSESVRQANAAREEGQVAERTRIRRDLHDDLGASIIRIAHESTDERTTSLAKAAMSDLRDVLTALQDTPTSCRDVLDDLEADLRGRAQADRRNLEWSVRGTADRVLSARSRANLTRVLRESMTNALKHGSGTVRYELELRDDELGATVSNEAAADGPIEVGMGMENIVSRLAELGGDASFSRSDGTFRLTLRLPWSAEP